MMRRDGLATVQAHYMWATVVMKCIDPDFALKKSTYLRIFNLLVHQNPISKRAILATRVHEKALGDGETERFGTF